MTQARLISGTAVTKVSLDTDVKARLVVSSAYLDVVARLRRPTTDGWNGVMFVAAGNAGIRTDLGRACLAGISIFTSADSAANY